jgi:hypothetical protein
VLIGKRLVISWIHGDFWQENILVNPAGTEVTGIVDWEWASGHELPSIDLINLLLSRRRLMGRSALGSAIIDFLREGKWTRLEQAILDASWVNGVSQPVDMSTLVVLSWLWHIRCSLTRKPHYRNPKRWLAKNASEVLMEIRSGITMD